MRNNYLIRAVCAASVVVFGPTPVRAQEFGQSIAAIPYALTLLNDPVEVRVEAEELRITAGPKTNLFNYPNGSAPVTNAPMVLFEPEGDFTLSAKITVEEGLENVYDVAALVLYQDDLV